MILVLTLLAIVFVSLLVLYLQFRWRQRFILAAASKLPCPPRLPLLGNTLLFMGSISDITKRILKITRELKGSFCIWIGPVPMFVVTDPADVQIILNSSSTLGKDDIYKFLEPCIGYGLVTAPVPIWKKTRRMMDPILLPSNVAKFLPVFNDVSKQLVDTLGVASKNGPTDPKYPIFILNIDAVLGAVLDYNSVDAEIKKAAHDNLELVGRMFMCRLLKPWLHIDWVFKLLYRKEFYKLMLMITKYKDTFEKNFEKVIENKRKIFEENRGLDYEPKSGKNFGHMYIENPENEQLRPFYDEVCTISTAATDTMVSALSFLLITLANHPDVQTKVYTEIQDVMGDAIRDVTIDDLGRLTYLGQTLMESMRLHGTFPAILRQANKDTKLSTTTLPAGSRILLALHAMGWNEDHFPNPELFRPERFGPKESGQRHSYAFIPFAGGPRNCIGKHYAMMLLKTAVVHILRRFRLKTQVRLEDIEYEMKVIMFSKTPLIISFEPRTSETAVS